jgi:hypothetical protein
MSKMSTVAVLKCRRCGRRVRCTHLSTTQSDPEAEQLTEFMRNLSKIALCDFCKAQRNYYASIGKGEAWEKGQVF